MIELVAQHLQPTPSVTFPGKFVGKNNFYSVARQTGVLFVNQ